VSFSGPVPAKVISWLLRALWQTRWHPLSAKCTTRCLNLVRQTSVFIKQVADSQRLTRLGDINGIMRQRRWLLSLFVFGCPWMWPCVISNVSTCNIVVDCFYSIPRNRSGWYLRAWLSSHCWSTSLRNVAITAKDEEKSKRGAVVCGYRNYSSFKANLIPVKGTVNERI